MKLDVLWEDAMAMVVNKPAGLLTVAPPGIESLETCLHQFLRQRDALVQSPYVGVPHRIDRPVSGAVLIARTARATKLFGAQFEARRIEKTYLAVVSGMVEPREGTWTDLMRKIPDVAQAELCHPEQNGAKRAVAHYRLLGSSDGRSLLELQLETGRMHQLRLQAASRGHPIVGDVLYGGAAWRDRANDVERQSIALHARLIRFRHPKTAKPIAVTAPLPETWNFLESSLLAAANG